jgi:hypothetical protein
MHHIQEKIIINNRGYEKVKAVYCHIYAVIIQCSLHYSHFWHQMSRLWAVIHDFLDL